ncbi:MAG: flagellin [Synergistaceae bacterium]|jgi:flagellin|nr:flagellin [Synergistaceae bacterium]
MALIVNHNIPALQTYNAVNATTNSLQKSIQKLSTGLRINSAADDAAGLAISEKMRAQIRGLDRAVANSQDGISMIQTAEGALNETHSILQRMRELSVQAANDTLTQQDRAYIQLELDQLREEVTRIGNTTQFNKKKLLDGSAAVLWSTDNLDTKAIVNGGLRVIDQFGQKDAAEGNYKINIKAKAGVAEAQKTNVFRIKHETGEIITANAGVSTLTAGYTGSRTEAKNNTVVTANGSGLDEDFLKGLVSGVSNGNWNVVVEDAVYNAAGDSGKGELTLTLTAGAPDTSYLGADGVAASAVKGTNATTVVINTAGGKLTAEDGGGDELGTLNFRALTAAEMQSIGTAVTSAATGFKLFSAGASGANAGFTVTATADDASTGFKTGTSVTYNFQTTDVRGNLTVTLLGGQGTIGFSTDFAAIGDIAMGDTKLRDLQQFWNSEGRFLLDDPQTITITQGNGKLASFTLYGDDTVGVMVQKLNEAIGNGLGQNTWASGFAEFVPLLKTMPTAGALTAPGTVVIRSVVPGADGRLSFSGDEDLMKALGLSVLQEAKESTYTVTITDAHDSSKTLVNAVTVTGNKLIGLVHSNIDVVFDAMIGVTVTNKIPDATTGFFLYGTAPAAGTDTFLHLADNTTVYQIGANEGEDMGVNIGDMRAEALGLNRVLVTDRESAARSITIIDNAIDKVSMQRAKLGAYQNRLEHTITNLTVAGENLTAAESRIRDTDMAKEMMNFTKLQIMLQAGTSMLAQANALPQNVLSLLR